MLESGAAPKTIEQQEKEVARAAATALAVELSTRHQGAVGSLSEVPAAEGTLTLSEEDKQKNQVFAAAIAQVIEEERARIRKEKQEAEAELQKAEDRNTSETELALQPFWTRVRKRALFYTKAVFAWSLGLGAVLGITALTFFFAVSIGEFIGLGLIASEILGIFFSAGIFINYMATWGVTVLQNFGVLKEPEAEKQKRLALEKERGPISKWLKATAWGIGVFSCFVLALGAVLGFATIQAHFGINLSVLGWLTAGCMAIASSVFLSKVIEGTFADRKAGKFSFKKARAELKKRNRINLALIKLQTAIDTLEAQNAGTVETEGSTELERNATLASLKLVQARLEALGHTWGDDLPEHIETILDKLASDREIDANKKKFTLKRKRAIAIATIAVGAGLAFLAFKIVTVQEALSLFTSSGTLILAGTGIGALAIALLVTFAGSAAIYQKGLRRELTDAGVNKPFKDLTFGEKAGKFVAWQGTIFNALAAAYAMYILLAGVATITSPFGLMVAMVGTYALVSIAVGACRGFDFLTVSGGVVTKRTDRLVQWCKGLFKKGDGLGEYKEMRQDSDQEQNSTDIMLETMPPVDSNSADEQASCHTSARSAGFSNPVRRSAADTATSNIPYLVAEALRTVPMIGVSS